MLLTSSQDLKIKQQTSTYVSARSRVPALPRITP
nr:MAG TPA: hypothetical protein [Caudoviricetes sp.]